MRSWPAVVLGLWCAVAGAAVQVEVGASGLSWRVGTERLGPGDRWLQVKDVAAGGDFQAVAAVGHGGAFEGRQADLRFSGRLVPRADGTEISLSVQAEPLRDRAVVVRLALPLAAIGWRWWDDFETQRPIAAGKRYEQARWWGQGRTISRYPFACVTSPQQGVMLATPQTEPRVYRLAYDATLQALTAEFELGLSPDARQLPGRAEVRLLVLPVSPEWGLRDAWRRYAELHADCFKRRVGEGGIWLLGFAPDTMDCPWDYGLRFDEGAERRTPYDQAHGIHTFVYTEPWGRYIGFRGQPTADGKPRHGEKAPVLKPDELVARIRADAAKPDRDGDWARTVLTSAIEDENGHWVWRHWTDEWSPGVWLSNVTQNPSPHLPSPNRAEATWRFELDPAFELARQNGAELSGVYLDSISTFMGFTNDNYRRDHWAHARLPLVVGWGRKAPAQLHGFACYEFAQQVWSRALERRQLVIGNTDVAVMQFYCHLLDMIGAGEPSGVGNTADEQFRFLRSCAGPKPVSWMAYGYVNPKTAWAEKEAGHRRNLFYAVHPGTGPFERPASYEPSRPLFRAYEPLTIWLDQAGWQPVPEARAPGVLIERYGPWQGVTFLALRNPGREVRQAAVSGRLPAGDVAWALLRNRPVVVTPAGDQRRFELDLGPDATEVVAFGDRTAVAGLWLSQARQWLQRVNGEAEWMATRAVGLLRNGDFEQGLSGWGQESRGGAKVALEERQPLSGKRSLSLTGEGGEAFTAPHQNLVLAPGDYRLRLRYRWASPGGKGATLMARFGVKGPDGQWLTRAYVNFADLPPTAGQVADIERRFTIPAGHSAGFFQFVASGAWGRIEIDEVAVEAVGRPDSRAALTAVGQQAQAELANWPAAPQVAALLDGLAGREGGFHKLQQLVAAVAEDHPRRSLALAVDGYAEALGRATEVGAGVVAEPAGPGLFGAAAVGSSVTLAPRLLRADGTTMPMTVSVAGQPASVVPIPAEVPYGWHDVLLEGRVTVGGRSLWLPRRRTWQVMPALQVSAAGPLSAVGGAVRLTAESWLDQPTPVKLSARVTVGGQTSDARPATVTVARQKPTEVRLTLPATLGEALEQLAARGAQATVQWRAEPPTGTAVGGDVVLPVVRGARCGRLAAPPVIDGRIAPTEWSGATRLEGFVAPDSGQPAARRTVAWVACDQRTLYLAFRCEGQAAPRGLARPLDGPVWEDDAVEVFVQPPGQGYYHLAVNAGGSVYDARCTPALDSGWNGTWTARTARAGEAWTVEIAVPLATLSAKPAGLWRLNLGREEADTKRASCWCPLLGGFHTPARFGELAF